MKRSSRPHALLLWLQEEGMTQTAGAARLGISVSHLNELIHGIKRPSGGLVSRMRDESGGRVSYDDFWPDKRARR